MNSISKLPRLTVLLVVTLFMGLSVSGQSSEPTDVFDPTKGPLILVDHIPIQDSSELSFLAPSDIDSVSVYKGQSAIEVYGSEGKNGVVLVYTKKGNFAELRQSFYFSKLEEAVQTWQESPKKTHFILNGAELPSPTPLEKLTADSLEGFRVMSSREARKEFGFRGKGTWYVITTHQ
ncbi:MAG: TonB-dependent receptor plug domain-containing protein [Bacteroidota bacterium]